MDMNQITLGALDMTSSMAFYQKLGFRLIVLSDDRYARFELPRGTATFSLHLCEEPIGPSSSMLYFEVEDLDKKYAELMAEGIKFTCPPTDQPWLWREAHLCDPAGNILCLYHAGENRRYPPWRITP
jgi:predicted enzyme related to lactoylglutathione lyase